MMSGARSSLAQLDMQTGSSVPQKRLRPWEAEAEEKEYLSQRPCSPRGREQLLTPFSPISGSSPSRFEEASQASYDHNTSRDNGSRSSLSAAASPCGIDGQDGRYNDDVVRRESNNQICYGMLADIKLRSCQITGSTCTAAVIRSGSGIYDRNNQSIHLGSLDTSITDVLHQFSCNSLFDTQLSITRSPHGARGRSNYVLSAILYGPQEHANIVATFLEDNGLFLQDPRRCDRNVPYINPQALSQVPRMTLEEPVIVAEDTETYNNPSDLLAELEPGSLFETPTPSALQTELFAHQKQALTFMQRRERGWNLDGHDLWQCVARDTLYRNTVTGDDIHTPPPEFRGGILADQMGMGKSLSMIALIASDKDNLGACTGTTLLVVRAVLLETWAYQLRTHLRPGRLKWDLHHGNRRIRSPDLLEGTDIVLTTYHTLMAESKKNKYEPQLMFNHEWRRVVLDEAHDIRDERTMIARAVCALKAQSRWALTGTPIQNRLSDLASLYRFLRLYPYDTANTLNQHVAQLLKQHGVEKVQELMAFTMLRRSIRKVQLPEREDLIKKLAFSADEQSLHDQVKSRARDMTSDTLNVLCWVNKLLMICNLGTGAKVDDLLQSEEELRSTWNSVTAQKAFDSLVSTDEATCSYCHIDLLTSTNEVMDSAPDQDRRPRLSKCLRLICGSCLEQVDGCGHDPMCLHEAVSTLSSGGNTQVMPVASTKVNALLHDLNAHAAEEKSVVFSFWTTTLDMIGAALDRAGITHVRIDGSVAHKRRDALLDTFRREHDVRVVLLTLSCGSVGLDLTVASRAYLMEPNWNPSIEQQALARVYRMGQTRKVTTIRYIIKDTLEEHVLKVQGNKQLLTDLLMPEHVNPSRTGSDHIRQLQSYL